MTHFTFDWDPAKAVSNLAKHGVAFVDAMGVFADPLASSIPDPTSPRGEERWVTIGLNYGFRLLVVIHTYADVSDDTVAIRIISSRPATKTERRQYEHST